MARQECAVVSQRALPLSDLQPHHAGNHHAVTSRAAAHCNSASSAGHSACPHAVQPSPKHPGSSALLV